MPTRFITTAALACLVLTWAGSTQAADKESLAASITHALQGKLTYYAHKFAGRKTASGELYDPNAMTMAHKTLPFGTLVRVTNPRNQRSVVVRVNDRGPWAADRVGDVSMSAAKALQITRLGVLRQAQLEIVAEADTEPESLAE